MAPFRRKPKGEATRIFFAADLHGSEPTFRKFLNAASFYDVDALVFGGDLMGKALVPIVRDGDRYRAHLHGDDHELDAGSLDRFCRMVEVAGFYWRVVDRMEHEQLGRDPLLVRGLFQDRARERLSSWLELAKDRLAGTPVRMYLTGGNDDEPGVLEVLSEADGDHVVACEDEVVELGEALVARRAQRRRIDVILGAQRREQVVAELVGRRHRQLGPRDLVHPERR